MNKFSMSLNEVENILSQPPDEPKPYKSTPKQYKYIRFKFDKMPPQNTLLPRDEKELILKKNVFYKRIGKATLLCDSDGNIEIVW